MTNNQKPLIPGGPHNAANTIMNEKDWGQLCQMVAPNQTLTVSRN
jgi:hypothetical protein